MERPQKLRGRPVQKTGLRNKKIDARFTQQEFDQIIALETALGIKRTELIRLRVLQGATQIVINARSLIDQLDKIGENLGKSSENIAQLTSYVGALDKSKPASNEIASRYNSLLEQYNTIQQSLELVMRKIVRQLSRP